MWTLTEKVQQLDPLQCFRVVNVVNTFSSQHTVATRPGEFNAHSNANMHTFLVKTFCVRRKLPVERKAVPQIWWHWTSKRVQHRLTFDVHCSLTSGAHLMFTYFRCTFGHVALFEVLPTSCVRFLTESPTFSSAWRAMLLSETKKGPPLLLKSLLTYSLCFCDSTLLKLMLINVHVKY